jgi:hypothetical protein
MADDSLMVDQGVNSYLDKTPVFLTYYAVLKANSLAYKVQIVSPFNLEIKVWATAC